MPCRHAATVHISPAHLPHHQLRQVIDHDARGRVKLAGPHVREAQRSQAVPVGRHQRGAAVEPHLGEHRDLLVVGETAGKVGMQAVQCSVGQMVVLAHGLVCSCVD